MDKEKRKFPVSIIMIIRIVITAAVMSVGIMFAIRNFPELMWVYIFFGFLFIPKKRFELKRAWIADIILPFMSVALTVYLDHLCTMYNRDYYKAVKTIWGYLFTHKFFLRTGIEICFVLALYFLLRFINLKPGLCAALAPLPTFILCLVNYFVYEFRNMIFTPVDLFGTRTAMEVMDNYEFHLKVPVMILILPYALAFAAFVSIKIVPLKKDFLRKEIYCGAATILSVTLLLLDLNVFIRGEEAFTFNYIGTIHNGYVTNFAMLIRDMNPSEPKDYDENREFAAKLVEESENYKIDTTDSANIIIVMNESYMDTSLYQDRWEDYVDPDHYWDYYSRDCIHGYAVASVFGGQTPNSEFSVLTGIPTAFLPGGATPYSMYISEPMFSLASFLKAQGYDTYAIHTYRKYGWSRDKVYPLLGFDEFLSSNEITYYTGDLLRGYASDKTSYRKILDHLDSLPEGQKTFTFLVTMQNHGGYTEGFEDFNRSIELHDSKGKLDVQASNYFSLVKESDNALQYLISELRSRDEKYVLLIFGDHQPNIGLDPDMDAGGEGWIVPYMIWANYDIKADIKQYDDPKMPTSLNYLGIDILKAANIKLPPYFEFIEEVRDDVPAIGVNGYRNTDSDSWNEISSSVKDYGTLLNKYRALQYYVLFDS